MKLSAPPELAESAAAWDDLSRWDRAELGRSLRLLGWTYSEIQELIPVPKGTLAGWCREIRLSEEQVEAIKTRRPPGIRTGVPIDTQWRRRLEIEEVRDAARTSAATHIGDPLWAIGVALYWGEGSKTNRRLEMANADADVLRVFMNWCDRYLMPGCEFTLALNFHADNDEKAARQYWGRALGLADPKFTKTFIKPDGTGHRKNHLSYGVCRINVRRSTDAWFTAMEWIELLPVFLEIDDR